MIKGITPALAEGGKIKIGGLGEERTGSGGKKYRMPRRDDHFTITTTQRDARGDLIVDAQMMALLPHDQDGKCREIPILLHSDEIDEVFPTTYALYAGKKLWCRGDGETAERYTMQGDKRTGDIEEMPCPCSYLGATDGPQCKSHGSLLCSIRVPERALAGAVHRWRTTSLISIQRMIGSLQQIRDVCGTLCGVPLVLKVEPIQVTPLNAPASTVYCCHVELRAADIAEVQRQAIQSAQIRAQVRQASNYKALVAPPAYNESPEEQAEVAAEFYPNTEDAPPLPPPRPVAPPPAPIATPRSKSQPASSGNAKVDAIAEIKSILTREYGEDHLAELAMSDLSAFVGKDNKERRLSTWADLERASDKWVQGVARKAREAFAEAANGPPDTDGYAEPTEPGESRIG